MAKYFTVDDLRDALVNREKEVKELKQAARDIDDKRPYWLWRSMLEKCSEWDCDREGEGDDCMYSGDCITEWCVSCAASGFLNDKIIERVIQEGESSK